MDETCCFSIGDQKSSISSTGGGSWPRVPHHASELLLRRGEKFPSLILGIGNDDIAADHYVRCFELFRRLKPFPVNRHRLVKGLGGKMGSESIGQSESGSELGAKQTGSQNPEWHVGVFAWDSMDPLIFLGLAEQGLKLDDILWKIFGCSGPLLNARSVCWSVPGARPRPRYTVGMAKVPNCSAISMGEWLGSIMPPAPPGWNGCQQQHSRYRRMWPRSQFRRGYDAPRAKSGYSPQFQHAGPGCKRIGQGI